MAKQSLIQIRVDDDLKNEVTEIYEKLGLDLPTAIRIFLTKTKLENGIPFDVKMPKKEITTEEALNALAEIRKQTSSLPDISLEEINYEINESRKERKQA